MTIGEHIMLLRKQNGLSQAALGKKIGTSGDIIGRYERNIMTPSVDVIIKISDILKVSIDYLVGKTNLVIDKETIKRLEEINSLSEEKKQYILNHLDILIRDFKTRQTYGG
jgi:transcriptional regulator with XRE-family HTH domain